MAREARSSVSGLTWGVVYALIFAYRTAMSIVAETVVARLTLLGDTSQYSRGEFTILEQDLSAVVTNNRQVATQITESIGAFFYQLSDGNPIAINLGFQVIGFIGIVIFLRSLTPRDRIAAVLLLTLPSFTIWSSIAGKEAIVVFATGIIGAYIVRVYQGRETLTIGVAFSVLVVYLFKDHYLPAVFFLVAGPIIFRRVKQKTFGLILAGLGSLAMLYLVRDTVDALSFEILRHFEGTEGSTRLPFWVEQYDVFVKAPYGMFMGFFGPTVAEASRGILQLMSFVESSIMVAILLYLALGNLPRLPAFMVVMSSFTIFWLLFATYPLAIMNPGSAVRYRTGYEILLFVAVALILSRERFVQWTLPSLSRARQRLHLRRTARAQG